MARNEPIEIGTRVFKTKAELKELAKSILNKYGIGQTLDESDFGFVLELAKRHPEYNSRLVGSGIEKITVRLAPPWKTRCFYIIRRDGSSTDFSYDHCINNDTANEPSKMFRQAARRAIKDQVVKYVSNYRKQTQDKDGNIICEATGVKLKMYEEEVDHVSPLTFDEIVNNFVGLKRIDLSKVGYTGLGDNEVEKHFADENLRNEFAEYHKSVARLQVVSRTHNRTQKKKNIGQ